MKVTVSRKAHFNAAHRLYRSDWDDERNNSVFGKCSNKNFHGHNYELIVSVRGEIDSETGYVIDMKTLKDLIKFEIEEAFDHKNRIIEVSDIQNLNPTAEHIVVVIYNKLFKHMQDDHDLEVVLYETPRNFVKYSGQ